jgi:hydroxymethylglutaryl-CoA lyase
MGLANALAALNAGIDRFDASLGGLGGCPYAPGASGNICTEDLVHMFQRMGLNTGVDLDGLLQCAADLPQLVGHDVPGAVLKAGKADRRYRNRSGRRKMARDRVRSVSKKYSSQIAESSY